MSPLGTGPCHGLAQLSCFFLFWGGVLDRDHGRILKTFTRLGTRELRHRPMGATGGTEQTEAAADKPGLMSVLGTIFSLFGQMC